MRKTILILILSVSLAAMWTSCKKLERENADTINEDDVWDARDSAAVMTQAFLWQIYSYLPNGFNRVGGDYLDAASGDAIPSRKNTTVEYYTIGRVNAENNPDPYWNQCYFAVRRTNLLLENIYRSATKPQAGVDPKQYFKAEARFIRAMVYFEMLKRYGGVPLIGDKVYTKDESFQVPRNTFAEVVNYIVSECDAIKNDLRKDPLPDGDFGRISRAAALALKCRTLLYAASPLYNGGGFETDPVKKALTGYPTNDPARWNLVVAAAEEFLALPAHGFALYQPAASPGYSGIFTTKKNTDIILAKTRSNQFDIETLNAPVGFTNPASNGRTSPTQEFVDAFPMADGTSATSANGVSYVGRDPRFYAIIFYNGSKWLSRDVETFEGGKDKPNSPLVPVQTRTGYYLRKFMADFSTNTSYSNQSHNYPIFRFAEIILNYAEALNEVGRVEDAVTQIKAIRNRARITAGTNTRYGIKVGITQAEMRDLIRNERRIELAFEEHRFWDIRRWKIAEQVLNAPVTGVKILKNTNGTFTTPERVQVGTSVFNQRLYHMPIPYDEIVKNSQLIQNEGW